MVVGQSKLSSEEGGGGGSKLSVVEGVLVAGQTKLFSEDGGWWRVKSLPCGGW